MVFNVARDWHAIFTFVLQKCLQGQASTLVAMASNLIAMAYSIVMVLKGKRDLPKVASRSASHTQCLKMPLQPACKMRADKAVSFDVFHAFSSKLRSGMEFACWISSKT